MQFPRLPFASDATVKGWKAYDTGLVAGSDIAILALDKEAPSGAWVACDARRPVTGSDVAAFEYKTGRSDGDPREACVHDPEGSVISLSGHRFIENGLSGTGLFYKDPAERLLGIVAWAPEADQQTEAYVIPADEILKLKNTLLADTVKNADHAIFDAVTECFLAQVGGNVRPFLEPMAKAARAVIDKPAQDWTEADINDLLSLHIEIISLDGDGGLMPAALRDLLKKLASLTGELTDLKASFAENDPLDRRDWH